MGILLTYDCCDENSFNNIKNWVKQIEQHASSDVAKILIGNKCDLPEKKIDSAKGRALADEFGMTFFETSAIQNINIKDSFYHIAKEIKEKQLGEKGTNLTHAAMITKGRKAKKSGSCC